MRGNAAKAMSHAAKWNTTVPTVVLLSGRHRPDTLVIQASTSRQRSDDLSGA